MLGVLPPRPGTAHLCLYSAAGSGHKCYWSGLTTGGPRPGGTLRPHSAAGSERKCRCWGPLPPPPRYNCRPCPDAESGRKCRWSGLTTGPARYICVCTLMRSQDASVTGVVLPPGNGRSSTFVSVLRRRVGTQGGTGPPRGATPLGGHHVPGGTIASILRCRVGTQV